MAVAQVGGELVKKGAAIPIESRFREVSGGLPSSSPYH